jgi:hypothetical protein
MGSVPTIGPVTRWTIELDDDLAARVADAAAKRGVAPERLAGEIVAEGFPAPRTLGFVGLGESTNGRSAADDEEQLAEGFGH